MAAGLILNVIARAAATSAFAASLLLALVNLTTGGGQSGRLISFPVAIAEHRGERYLVAMLGDHTNWVRNVRAASGGAVLRQGRRRPVQLEEIPVEQRAPVLRRYLSIAPGARPHFPVTRGAPLEDFERIAAQYPVFRVTFLAGPPSTGPGAGA